MNMSDHPGANAEYLSRIERTPLVATVMERIRQLVESGALGASGKLPSERTLGEQFRVGRSTVREALKALEALGLIEIRHGQGAFVKETPTANWPGVQPEDPVQSAGLEVIVEARLAIEPHAAALAAVRRTDEHLATLQAFLNDFDKAIATSDQKALIKADVDFHAYIAEIGNPLLLNCLRSMEVLLINSRWVTLSRPSRRESVALRHKIIFEAITSGRPEIAATAMSDHLNAYLHENGVYSMSILGPILLSKEPDYEQRVLNGNTLPFDELAARRFVETSYDRAADFAVAANHDLAGRQMTSDRLAPLPQSPPPSGT